MGLASVEKSWEVRGTPGEFGWGEPYQIAMTIERVTSKTALIKAQIGKQWPGFRHEVGCWLKSKGFERVIWEDGDGREHEQDLARFPTPNRL